MIDCWIIYLVWFYCVYFNIKLWEKGWGENFLICIIYIGSDDLIDLIKDDEIIYVEKFEKLKVMLFKRWKYV